MSADFPEHEVFELADWRLDCGQILPLVRLAYRSHGREGEGAPIWPASSRSGGFAITTAMPTT